jgi:iron complex outermembrane receptor protein
MLTAPLSARSAARSGAPARLARLPFRIVLALGVLIALAGAAAPPDARAQQSATLTGTVVAAGDGETLPGANVLLRETDAPEVVAGTATDQTGAFRLTGIPPGRYVLETRFVGYRPDERTLLLEAGESRDLTIEMREASALLDAVVVSASRRREKVLDAPASVSVLEPREIQREVSTSAVEAIRSTPGVDMAQTGIDRREVVLRGFNNAFSGAAHVLTDYREAAVPSLAVNVHSIMPNMTVDLERVEVVRGPGSALYGPGVDSGVIHYLTKDPFQHPGTTVSVSGGSRAYFSGQFRQAGVIGESLGYKFTGQFARADEWALNPSNPQDAEEIDRYRTYASRQAVPGGRRVAPVDRDGDDQPEAFQLRREDLYRKFNVNGLLQYRVGSETTVSLNGGYAQLKSTVLSGIGTLQADGFGYSYGQVRLQSGGLFAQVYLNANDAGSDTYVYGSGDTIVDNGLQWNGQVQYDFGLPGLATDVIAGADADITIPRTSGEILGRNEDEDRIAEYGSYAQATTDLSERVALTLAGRLDYNNVVENLQVSPRAALVFKPTPNNTLRASFNRAISSPATNSNFLDIESQRRTLAPVRNPATGQPTGETFDLVFRALGAADGFTFRNFRQNRTATYFLPTGPAPGPGNVFGQSVPLATYPIAPVYGATAQGFRSRLNSGAGFSGTLGQLSDAALGAYADLLAAVSQATLPVATTSGEDDIALGIPDDSPLGYRAVDGPTDIDPLEQTTTQTVEVGYQGLLGNRFSVQVDTYYERKQDFIGPLRVESPLVYLAPSFLAGDLQTKIGTNPNVAQAFQEFLSTASGISQEQAIELLTGTFGSTASGVVQPDTPFPGEPDESQDLLPGPDPSAVGAFLSYRNFGEVEYWGVDASVEAQVSDALTAFANASYVSDDFFDNRELEETDTELSLALNAPQFKVRGGGDYTFDGGLSIGATGHYVDGFPVRSGPYVGDVESYFLLDLRARYDFTSLPGLSAGLTAKNVLDNEHRQFVGAPPLGFTLFGRLTYTL